MHICLSSSLQIRLDLNSNSPKLEFSYDEGKGSLRVDDFQLAVEYLENYALSYFFLRLEMC